MLMEKNRVMNEEPSEEWVSYQQGIRDGREESKDRIEQLEADMRRLEQIYNRDQVAQVFANEIETIFDRWAIKLNATERY
jgi:hypothetical protein